MYTCNDEVICQYGSRRFELKLVILLWWYKVISQEIHCAIQFHFAAKYYCKEMYQWEWNISVKTKKYCRWFLASSIESFCISFRPTSIWICTDIESIGDNSRIAEIFNFVGICSTTCYLILLNCALFCDLHRCSKFFVEIVSHFTLSARKYW